MARGNARQDIYVSNRDRISFLHTIEAVSWKQGLVCHAYCMMNNHFHLLVETPRGNLSRCMKYLNGVYTQGFNFRHGRTGHVFEGRYKSNVVDRDAYLLELARYIVLNPVRASLVNEPSQWPWSSYNATAGYANRPSFLTTALIPGLFSDDGGTARRLYREFVLEGWTVSWSVR